MGIRVHQDRRTVTVYVPTATRRRPLANLEDNGQIAATFCYPPDAPRRADQGPLHGRAREHRRPIARSRRSSAPRWSSAFAVDRHPARARRAACRGGRAPRSTSRSSDVFVQTPGPRRRRAHSRLRDTMSDAIARRARSLPRRASRPRRSPPARPTACPTSACSATSSTSTRATSRSRASSSTRPCATCSRTRSALVTLWDPHHAREPPPARALRALRGRAAPLFDRCPRASRRSPRTPAWPASFACSSADVYEVLDRRARHPVPAARRRRARSEPVPELPARRPRRPVSAR